MTTKKPEVVSIYNTATGTSEEVISLSDYEALQADRDQQYQMKVKAREQRDRVTAELNALQAECDQLRKDAERYRWLEPHLYVLQVSTLEGRIFEICIDGAEVPAIDSPRQAIDKAIQEQTK